MKNRFYIFITLTLILSCQLHSCENKANKKTFIMTAVEKNDLAVVQLLIAHDNLININNEELYRKGRLIIAISRPSTFLNFI
jgi:hypothetical protein